MKKKKSELEFVQIGDIKLRSSSKQTEELAKIALDIAKERNSLKNEEETFEKKNSEEDYKIEKKIDRIRTLLDYRSICTSGFDFISESIRGKSKHKLNPDKIIDMMSHSPVSFIVQTKIPINLIIDYRNNQEKKSYELDIKWLNSINKGVFERDSFKTLGIVLLIIVPEHSDNSFPKIILDNFNKHLPKNAGMHAGIMVKGDELERIRLCMIVMSRESEGICSL